MAVELNNLVTKTDGKGNNYLGLDNATRIPGFLSLIAGAAMSKAVQSKANKQGAEQNVGAPGNYFLLEGSEDDPKEVMPTALILISDPTVSQIVWSSRSKWKDLYINSSGKLPTTPKERLSFNVKFTAAQINSFSSTDKKKIIELIKYLNKLTGKPTIKKDDRVLIVGKQGKYEGTSYTGTSKEYHLDTFQKTHALGGKAGGLPHKQTPSTEKQEKVTLRIMEVLLKSGGYNTANKTDEQLKADFDYLCTGGSNNPNASTNMKTIINGRPLMNFWKGLSPTPGLEGGDKTKLKYIPGASFTNKEGGDPRLRSWYNHFLLQFKDIEKNPPTGIGKDKVEGKYNFYTYDEFMGFITKLVQSGPLGETSSPSKVTSEWKQGAASITLQRKGGWPYWPGGRISQKDSWNPADVWLINVRRIGKYVKEIKRADTINQVNDALIKAYEDQAIFGISLKKSSAKQGLHFELINFSIGGKFKPMAKVTYEGWDLKLGWASNSKGFTHITNELKVKEKDPTSGKTNGKGAEMRIGSSQSGPHNINLEYKPTGGAAQLGKVPKELLRTLITKKKIPADGAAGTIQVPTLQDAEDSIPETNTDAKYKAFKAKIDTILNSTSPITVQRGQLTQNGKYIFIEHIMKAKQNAGWDSNKDDIRKNVTMGIQILNWAWVLASIKKKSDTVFNKFIQDTYYFAQKKGEISKDARFGPFGKLS